MKWTLSRNWTAAYSPQRCSGEYRRFQVKARLCLPQHAKRIFGAIVKRKASDKGRHGNLNASWRHSHALLAPTWRLLLVDPGLPVRRAA